MINSVDFTNRLKKLIDYYEISASIFADKVGVQRSSISHILSGRNKPSLDFVLKVTTEFKEVTLEWLIHGIGNFPAKTDVAAVNTTTPLSVNNKIAMETSHKKVIQKILVFYTDGTFDEFKN